EEFPKSRVELPSGIKPVHRARSQQEQHSRRDHAQRTVHGPRLQAWIPKQNFFDRAAHRSIRTFLSSAAPAHAISKPVTTYIAAATANAGMPAAESVAILDTSVVSSRPGNGTCDASEVDNISAMRSDVIGCTTARSA